ncbi:MAG: DMT family transporter [Treponema sp.]|jgi:drug/metabolite transporter (DMT)-like permease|nr:DMT family transporter [Treponema sp.]
MDKRAFRADILLLLTAGIWGFGFVAQSSGMEYVGPFTYNGVRFILGSLSLFPLILFRKSKGKLQTPRGTSRKKQFAMILAAGSVLFIAVAFQQLGLMFTTAGNAGFITGFYVVLTPVFGIFLGKKTRLPTWIGMGIAVIGIYFISMPENIAAINPGDLITIISAVFWACHILLIDRLVQKIDPLILSSGQFAFCALYASIAAVVIEPFVKGWSSYFAPDSVQSWKTFAELLGSPAAAAIMTGAAIPILYGGLASVGIAYTLQVVAQKDAPPAHATIILCLEGSFAAFGGMLLLEEEPGPFTLLGFVFMLGAMLITQWDVIFAKKQNSRQRSDAQ